MPITGSLDAQNRRLELTSRIERHGGLQIEDAAQELGVSAMTIRRDLADLEAAGALRRVRGGAVRLSGPQPFDERSESRRAAKLVIAAKAAELVPQRGTVAFDASTTVATLAERLGPREELTVLTNAIETMSALVPTPGVDALLTGGHPDPRTGSLVGPLASRAADALHTEVLFASAGALDPEAGATEASLSDAEVKRVLAAHTRRIVLCVDSAKLGGTSMAQSIALEDVAVLITELDPADERVDPYRGTIDVL